MQTVVKILIVIFLSGLNVLVAQEANTGEIKVSVTNVSKDEGVLVIGLYNTEKQWLKKVYMGTIAEIKEGVGEVSFKDVPMGEYAISLFHDENENQKLDMVLGFMPKEDYGCSNGAKGNFGPPKWEDAKFELSTTEQEININL